MGQNRCTNSVEFSLHRLHFPIVGDPLRLVPIPNFYQGIVQQLVSDFAFPQLRREPVVPVKVNLQTARQPGGHPDIGQAQFFVEKVEIVVQALAVVRL
jgi:hypothetical protein